jgi:hypothetical protein
MRVSAAVIFAAACAAALPACGSTLKRRSDFLEDLRAYNNGVRWQNPAEAAQHIPKQERDEFLAERAELDDLRVGDYEVVRIRWEEGRESAEVQVKYTWHLDSRGLVHTTTTRQRWKLYGKTWMMVEERRVRGEPMPGVAEPFPEKKPTKTAQPCEDAGEGA